MYVDTGKVKIHYQARGEAEQTLVLIHGLGMSSELWKSQIPEFSKHFRTIAVDLRGFGKSERPDDPDAYSIDAMTKDIIELIKSLEIHGCHLLGTSMGGFVAQSLAIAEPTLCKSLILCHTAPKMSIPENIINERVESLLKMSLKEYGALVAEQACSPRASFDIKSWVVNMITKNDKSTYTKVLTKGLSDFDVTRSLSRIVLPTLVVVGENDRVLPPEEGRKIAQLVKNSKIVEISEVGHLGYAEKPRTFNNLVLDFLKEL